MIMNLIGNHVAARIDDGDEGFEVDDWQQETHDGSAVTQPSLQADRWWVDVGQVDEGSCLGISCNIWTRALRRRVVDRKLWLKTDL